MKLFFFLTASRVILKYGYGRVVVSQYGLYASVCADAWTDVEAEITCKMYGFKGKVVLSYQLWS